jgi:RimJ/RimL family protein N-acetyltransferase
MDSDNSNEVVVDLQKEQMLKLITRGFYKELINYGIDKKNIVTVSSNLLDYLLQDLKDSTLHKGDEYYNQLFAIKSIKDDWKNNQKLTIGEVSISSLMPEMYKQISAWLENPAIKYSFIPPFPEEGPALQEYFENPKRAYFTIYYANEPVGLIGADNVDSDSKKLEMKKLIGNRNLQGKGIGKSATFLFLYYSFLIMRFEKVYIHSGDTNIRNIMLNNKFGFELEGIFFSDIQVQNKMKDVVRMGLMRSRWMEIFSAK